MTARRVLAALLACCGVACGASKLDPTGDAPPDGGGARDGGPASSDGGAADGGTDGGSPATDAARDAGPPNEPPIASFSPAREAAGTWRFDASESRDPDGTIVSYAWDLGDGSAGEGAVVTHAFAAAGCPTVRLVVTDDRGAEGAASERLGVAVTDPPAELDARLAPLPGDGALLPRDLATNEATLVVSGTVTTPGWEEVAVRVLSAGAVERTERAPLCDGAFSLDVALPAELVARDLEVVLRAGERETRLGGAVDLVAGDVLLVQGQSNAVASMRAGDANENQGDFVRSFGSHVESGTASSADGAWHRAEGNAAEGPGAVGQWALRMAAQLVAEHGIPLAVLNGARGGQPIEYFARNDADPTDATTSYGRLLDRARRAGVAGRVRAILYYQGESDRARAAEHRDGFTALVADWQEDFPSFERLYVTQVREGCGPPSIELREVQRRFAATLPRTSVMSTHALDGHDGCHYAYAAGYRELGDRYARLLGRDLYGATAGADVEAIDVAAARLEGDAILVETTGDASAITVDEGAAADFALAGTTRTVTGVEVEGPLLRLRLSAGPTAPTGVAYLGHAMSGPWITNAAGVGLLAFQLELTP